MKDIAKKRPKPLKPGFEELYVAVRQHEKKVYSDDQLQNLPNFPIHSHEWEIRKHSSSRLLAYLQQKRKPLKILEIGCGNGWLSAKLAGIANTHVIGLDINRTEIIQAKRVFKKDNLVFINDSFDDNTFENEKFDIIVFAASVQYFPSVITVLQQAIHILSPGGQIHIIDTALYTPAEAEKAEIRCREYYDAMGIPEMAGHYFHHTISEFWSLKYKILFDPAGIINRFFKKDPFYWIAIYK